MSNEYNKQDLIDNLTYLNETKNIIKTAIENKGQSISTNTPFRNYVDAIENISGGGSNEFYMINRYNSFNELDNIAGHEGDMALVYEQNALEPIYINTEVSKAIFPKVISINSLDELPTNNYSKGSLASTNVLLMTMHNQTGVNSFEFTWKINKNDSAGIVMYNRYHNNPLQLVSNLTEDLVYNFAAPINIGVEDKPLTLFIREYRSSLKGINTYENNKWDMNFYLAQPSATNDMLYESIAFTNRGVIEGTLQKVDAANYSHSAWDYMQRVQNIVQEMPEVAVVNNNSIPNNIYIIPAYLNNKSVYNFYNITDLYAVCNSSKPNVKIIENLYIPSVVNNGLNKLFSIFNGVKYIANLYAPKTSIFWNSPSTPLIGIGSLTLNANLSNTVNMFRTFTNLMFVPNFNTYNVTNAQAMFSGCYNLKTIPNYNFNNVTNIGSMFSSCYNLESVPDIPTANLTYTGSAFSYCNHLKRGPNINTTKVISANMMFLQCDNMEYIPEYDMSNVVNLSCTFEECNSLKEIPNINIHKVTNLDSTFHYCKNMETVYNLDTRTVTNMESAFAMCFNLKSIPNFNTSNVINLAFAFQNCEQITSVPNFNTTKVNDLWNTFNYCTNLVDVPQLKSGNVTTMYSTFARCNKLSDASIQNIINMCLNSAITNTTLKTLKNTSIYGPFADTNISNTRYQIDGQN